MLKEETAPGDDAKTPRHAAVLGGAGPRNALGDLHALQTLSGHFARSLRHLLEPMLRRPVRIAAEPLSIVRLDAYLDARGDALAAYALITMPPLAGHAVAVIDGPMVFELLDLFYGGTGQVPSPLPAELPASAEAIIRRIGRGIAERLAATWGEVAQIAFAFERFETNPVMIPDMEGEDRVVVTRFAIALAESRSAAIDILYPAAALKPVAGALGARVKGKRGGDPAWFSGLTRAVMEVKLPVRSVLAEPVIQLSRLVALKPGDIIPISFGPEIPLFVADNRFARGSVGAANGRAALRIARIETLPDEDIA